jgi:hypothetical protein
MSKVNQIEFFLKRFLIKFHFINLETDLFVFFMSFVIIIFVNRNSARFRKAPASMQDGLGESLINSLFEYLRVLTI